MLATFFVLKSVTNILNLSSTHFVSVYNIDVTAPIWKIISVQSLKSLSYSFRDLFKSKNVENNFVPKCRLDCSYFCSPRNQYIFGTTPWKFQALKFFLTGICCVLCSIFQAIIPDQKILIITFGILAKFAAQSKFF